MASERVYPNFGKLIGIMFMIGGCTLLLVYSNLWTTVGTFMAIAGSNIFRTWSLAGKLDKAIQELKRGSANQRPA